ncbi:hypothetical protein BJY00DRAFT_308908 [Aspergillus carlsbadensis]|nr:hypothetical protein BJY00DRAFT_308908 [Aspergillus carlsbadensis]
MSCFRNIRTLLRDTLAGPRNGKNDDDDAEAVRVRNDCFLALSNAFETLERSHKPKVSSSLAKELQVSVRHLILDQDDTDRIPKEVFCQPYDMDRLKSLRSDIQNRVTRESLQMESSSWESAERDSTEAAAFLHCNLLHAFAGYDLVWPDRSRAEPLPGSCRMADHGYDDDILLPRYESFGYATDSPVTPWPVDIREAYVSQDDKPHVFIPLTHHCLPSQPLLRAELMLILGITLTRLKVATLKRHLIIPIMVLSCFREYTARLLQAYMTSDGLVVLKSDIYDFFPARDRPGFTQLFLSHMASTPSGDTTALTYTLPA